MQKFVVFELSCVRNVRSPAEIDVVSLSIERDRLALGKVVDQHDLVVLTSANFERSRILPAHFFANDGEFFVGKFAHLLFDFREVFLSERLHQVEIVVETVFDWRSDREFDAREQLPDRLRHQVRRAVSQVIERVSARIAIHSKYSFVTSIMDFCQGLSPEM